MGPAQQPSYADPAAVEAAVTRLRKMPPLVFAGECDELKTKLAAVARGRGVPAPGRRLRRDLRRRHRRQHPQQAARAAPDGRGPDLRRLGARGEARPPRRPVRQAALLRLRDPRRRDAAGLPRRRRQRLPLRRRVPRPRPAAARGGLPRVRRDAEPRARLRHRRLRRPAPGAHLEHRLRARLRGGPPLREDGGRDRPRAQLHGGDRRRPRRVPPRRLPLQPRGADPGVRARDDPHRQPHPAAVRRLQPLRLDRGAHPPARRRPRGAAEPHQEPDRGEARSDHHRRRRDRARRPSSTRPTSRAG